jgi:uncharacterized phage protein (TIGR01671 family)
MEKIKFRGFFNGWHYGIPVEIDGDMFICESFFKSQDNNHKSIISNNYQIVDSKTVTQYIGINDKNGKEIYVGDILKLENFTYENGQAIDEIRVVEYSKGCYIIKNVEEECLCDISYINTDLCEVIGNKFEKGKI